MSKEKGGHSPVQAVPEAQFQVSSDNAVVPPPLKNNPKLSDVDRLQLDLAKSNRKTALANAQKSLAENDVAELNYKYLVLQIYMRYNLTENDAINENGDIIIGGAVQTAPTAK